MTMDSLMLDEPNLDTIKVTPITELTISRSEWLRGPNVWIQGEYVEYAESYLHRPRDNRFCCLGIYCREMGVPTDRMSLVDLPSGVMAVDNLPEWLKRSVEGKPNGPARIASINDDKDLPEEEREEQIIDAFAKHGVTVTFID